MNTLLISACLALGAGGAEGSSWGLMMSPPSAGGAAVSGMAAPAGRPDQQDTDRGRIADRPEKEGRSDTSSEASPSGEPGAERAGRSLSEREGTPMRGRGLAAPAANPRGFVPTVPPALPVEPKAEEAAPAKDAGAPPPVERTPALWQATDVAGQVWTHPDRAWLETWVTERNRQLLRPTGTVWYSGGRVCTTGTCR